MGDKMTNTYIYLLMFLGVFCIIVPLILTLNKGTRHFLGDLLIFIWTFGIALCVTIFIYVGQILKLPKPNF
jgi:beta-lactamase regulating signal transducer with metallopeptidase domain